MDRYSGSGGYGSCDSSSDRRGGGGYRDQSNDRRGGGGYRDQSSDRRGGGRGGGRGGYRGGGRGGGYGGGDSFHKAAGGDYARMPESVAHPQKAGQHQAYGTEGRPIELVSNFYRIMSTDMSIYHYDVSITKVRVRPSAESGDVTSSDDPMDEKQQRLREMFIKKFADTILAKFAKENSEIFKGQHYAYDGWKNLYTKAKLNFSGDEMHKQLEMMICDRPATFNIKIQFVCRISLNEAVNFYSGKSSTPVSDQVIAVFDVIIRNVIGKSYATYQRKFFDTEDVESSPRVKLVDFVQGFLSAVRMTEFGMALNVNLKTSAIIAKHFRELMPFVAEVLNVSPRDLESINKARAFQASKMIRHLKIYTEHSKRKVEYTVDALTDKFPGNETFDCKGKRITYAEYFIQQYGIRLKQLPMVRTTKRNIHLPLELCRLKEGQFLNKTKIDGNMQREMLFKSTHTPNVYFHKVAKIVDKIKEADTERILKEFGLDLDPKATRIEGRVLPTPRTMCSNPRDRMHKVSQNLPKWGVFCFDNVKYREEDLQRFVKQMMDNARGLGLFLPEPSICDCILIKNSYDIFNVFNNVATKTDVEMIFIGIPSRHDTVQPGEMYSVIKHCCNQMYGLMNQCFSAEKMMNLPGGYFQQFLLKVNGKMGGENSVLDPQVMSRLPFNPAFTMLVGIDVANLASDGERLSSAVVAGVGSYSDNFTAYNTAIRVQARGETETVQELHGLLIDLLRQYEAKKHAYPKNLILFRSGLSDGQFDPVLAAEAPMIKLACSETGGSIKVVYIAVQKRHNARFALSQQDNSGRKPTFNVPSGTVVDKGIVNPTRRCFYLNSHFSPLGTSRSTKYTILRDDLKLSPDEVQKLCFYSCFNSCRTRSVISQPTPVRYADLLCQRTKNHLDAQRNAEGSFAMGRTTTTGSSTSLRPEEVDAKIRMLNEQVQLHKNVKTTLFYC